MAKAIFTTKVDPTYDDLPEQRYHFPRTYLRQAEQAVGDWILYYEPRRSSGDLSSGGGRQSYFATARLLRIEPDPAKADHFYGFVSNYLEFDHTVPFKEGQHYYESSLQRDDGGTNKGAFGRAVRLIPDHEYELILQRGFTQTLDLMKLENAEALERLYGFAEEPEEFKRPIVERMIARPFRDAAFAVVLHSQKDHLN